DPRWSGQRGGHSLGLAAARTPSAANPNNAGANAELRGRPPFDRVISLRPVPSCPAEKPVPESEIAADFGSEFPLAEPEAFTGDVREALQRATGLPIGADYRTRLYPVSKLNGEQESLFEAVCGVGDAMGVRWRKDGDFLVCRSTGYFWDRLREVPNRYLQRWV